MGNKIKLKEGNRSTHKLKMDGREVVVYYDGDLEARTVNWEIKNNHPDPNDERHIKAFRIVGPYPHPFTTNPFKDFGTTLELVVSENAPRQVWKYTIKWMDKSDKEHDDDPKISVLPSPLFPKSILVPIVVIATALLGLRLWSNKTKR